MIEIKIISALILTGRGTDKIMLKTEMEEACFPWTSNLMLSFDAAKGTGKEYVLQAIGLEEKEIEVIQI